MNLLKDNYHYFALGFWLLAIIPTLIWWRDSVLWVSLMSLYANVEVSLSAIHAKKAANK